MRLTPLFVLLFLALAAYGQMQERVAILNTVDDGDSIKVSDLIYLTNRLRETAVKVLPKQRYGVMTTESIIAFLGSQENARKVCNEASCLAEIGRKVSADYVAQARIGRFGNQLSINFQLYNTKTGNLIDSFTGNSKDVFGLLSIIDENAPALFKQMLDESKPTPPAPVAMPPAAPVAMPPAAPVAMPPAAPVATPPAPVAMPPTAPMAMPSTAPKLSPDLVAPIPANVETKSGEKSRTSFWVALGLDLVGVAVISAGYSKDRDIAEARDKYDVRGQSRDYYGSAYEDAENSRSSRNTLYTIGGIFLASGIGVHIWF